MSAESEVISAHVWKQIAHIWANMASSPISKPEEAVDHLWRGLSELVPFDKAFALVAHKGGQRPRGERFGFFGEWVHAHTFAAPGSFKESDLAPLLEYQRERVAYDEWVSTFVETAGRHRTFIREDILGDRPWSSCESGWLMEQLGLSDRMHSAYALDESVEVFLCLDRCEDQPFEPRDRDIVHELNQGLGPFWARLAMSYGLYEHQQMLTPRQHETLLHLLDGYSEPEIADLMGLTTGSAHQYVVAVFRALNVNSRAELMATWMGDMDLSTPES